MGDAISTLADIDIVKSVSGVNNPITKFADKTTKVLTESVLADSVIDSVHGAFIKLNTGFNIIIAVVVTMILISSFFLIYNSASDFSMSQLTNNIISLTLATSTIIAVLLIKITFMALDSTLFEDKVGVVRVAKRLMKED